jgi:hypothetical protein
VREADLYAPIIEAVRVSGLATIWRNQSGSVRARGGYVHLGPAGSPDLVGWMLQGPRRGAFVGLEVKRPGEQATLIQTAWRQDIEKAGGVAGVVRSVDDALAVLRAAARVVVQ